MVFVYQKVDASILIDQSIGSGAGIRQTEGSWILKLDAPCDEHLQIKNSRLPTVMRWWFRKIPGLTKDLRLTPGLVTSLFNGEIDSWNDPRLAASNPGAALPDLPVLVAYRSDGSGTTAIFTDYLSKISPDWATKVGKGTSVNWPTGQGGKGNEGVAGVIKQSEGTVGYIELIYAEKNGLKHAALQNKAGAFVHASTAAVTRAAEGSIATIPSLGVSITNADGKGSISGFTHLRPDAENQGAPDQVHWAISADGSRAPHHRALRLYRAYKRSRSGLNASTGARPQLGPAGIPFQPALSCGTIRNRLCLPSSASCLRVPAFARICDPVHRRSVLAFGGDPVTALAIFTAPVGVAITFHDRLAPARRMASIITTPAAFRVCLSFTFGAAYALATGWP